MTKRLTAPERADTAAWIASLQLPTGMIPWYPAGHADPWNHVEAAMALVASGFTAEAERALDWLASTQHGDGSWCQYYLADGVEEPRRDPNVCAYVATGVWWHYLVTGDGGVLHGMWPVVERAIDFVLTLQQEGGEILWSLDPDGVAGRYALLTGCSSMVHSLRCAVAIAEALGRERPDWELACGRLAYVVARRPDAFEPKRRWAMDWYYPVLCGALTGEPARDHLQSRWGDFVMEGLGVRCVSSNPWFTGAETSELVMALDAVGLRQQAVTVHDWTRHLRDEDGAYWTGCVHPQCVRFPGGERSTYTAAAVLMADHVLYAATRAAGIFRGECIPETVALAGEMVPGTADR